MEGNACQTNEKIAMRVSINTIVWNVVLTAFKLTAGIFAHSAAMLSDAVHSLSDVLSTFIVMIGVKISNKASDENHQYGHERFESVAAILLAVMLLATGLGIGYSGIQKIISGEYQNLVIPGTLALVAAAVSIVVKEAMFWYTRKAAKQIDSGALMADAWHHRSDALSSVGSFIGILGARMGLAVLDPIASVVICLFILKAAYDIFMDAVRKMTDEALDHETAQTMYTIALRQAGVIKIDKFSSRVFGDKYYVDVEIRADGALTLVEAHHIAQMVHDALEAEFPKLKHCMVHVNPSMPEDG
ncbi:cation diffusion facilitator family transporter [Christensenellaceae bacterium OttesenSCG-928-M15]|nr:cation diffusion facilitator family transporter [Christensenellaceae bacterium OttesenSCG-928-M15]